MPDARTDRRCAGASDCQTSRRGYHLPVRAFLLSIAPRAIASAEYAIAYMRTSSRCAPTKDTAYVSQPDCNSTEACSCHIRVQVLAGDDVGAGQAGSGGGLENRCGAQVSPWVRIPHPPLSWANVRNGTQLMSAQVVRCDHGVTTRS